MSLALAVPTPSQHLDQVLLFSDPFHPVVLSACLHSSFLSCMSLTMCCPWATSVNVMLRNLLYCCLGLGGT